MSANQLTIIKNELIAQILEISEEAKILELKGLINDVMGNEVNETNTLYVVEKKQETIYNESVPEELKKYASPFKKTLDIEQLVVEQNYIGLNKVRMDRLVKEMDIQEPLEDLLKMLD